MPWGLLDILKALALLLAAGGVAIGGVAIWNAAGQPGGRVTVLAGLAAVELTLLLAVWLFGVRRAGGDWREVGFRPFDFGQAITLILLACLLAIVANVGYASVLGALGLRRFLPPSPREIFGTGEVDLAVALVLASGIAPIVEEAFFRGFVFPGLVRRMGGLWAALGSSLLFAIFHGSLGAIAPITALGLVLTWMYVRTGSIWPSVMLHGLYNTAGVLAVLLAR